MILAGQLAGLGEFGGGAFGVAFEGIKLKRAWPYWTMRCRSLKRQGSAGPQPS
jgi:hypothetical protein